MNARALLAVPLLFFAIYPAAAQQENSPLQSTPEAGKPAVLTHEQMVELHADILMAEKDYEGAVKSYESLLSNDKTDARVLNKIGVACEQLGELHTAEHYFKRSEKADKTFASPLNNLGTVEYSKKNYGKAIHYYLKAVKLRDNLGAVYSNLGYAYFGKKEYVEAMHAFTEALAIDPDVFSNHGGMGSILQQRTSTDPGLFYFLVAKTYAQSANAEEAAHYLKLARDDGYKDFLSAQTDSAFAKVIKDPRVQEVLVVPPSYEGNKKTAQN
ncbi:MAG TPA: tetratricopeptide repeat protein [Candidatus Acidoferrum sp.]|nr:tetratricopeptide repeat protein [Candidatus Acidoferrum sp.]